MKSLEQLDLFQSRINDFLLTKLDELEVSDKKLLEAMRYGLLIGGKRMRPFLAYTVGEAVGVSLEDTDAIAGALECIHAYSLLHDDLPAMDDDDLRRGKPTCHKAFDEATAILAGDSLQTLAFDILANHTFSSNVEQHRVKLIQQLVAAAGYQGMCGGQALDLAATDNTISLEQLEHLHSLKTGALLSAAVLMPAGCAGKINEKELARFKEFADLVGLAYQVQDDIIDITSTEEQLGKPAGSDVAANKSTYPALLGLQGAIEKADDLYKQALQALSALPYNTQELANFATYIIKRNS